MPRTGTSAPRRDALVDVAGAMASRRGVEAVTVEAVAAASGVSRALVYKHFANREELLAELYRRESQTLHDALARAVAEAHDLEGMFRALVRGALDAQAVRGATFAALAAGGRTPEQRALQRRRDGATVRWFSRRAVEELGLDPATARTGAALALGGLGVTVALLQREASTEAADRLVEAYVAMAMGGLRALAGAAV